ncbi:hypothetical protein BD310DRAFT_82596 [Dichomitus squalens]|uniref:Uncharacterized protein n=1 Tax=Dichomitus squalens TaxID=114155 RepID=A0A4Q9PJM2_9APHY|nr:hypothetical protein BD310DRAFT_82596 [Dichomitus squalens]
MFNRTAEYLAHGARTFGPLAKLHPEQRQRLEKSSKKVGKVLGEMPLIDIIPASPRVVDGIVSEVKQSKKNEKSKKKAPPAPILRYKLAPFRRKSTRRVSGAAVCVSTRSRARKPVPNLDLEEHGWRIEADSLSPSRMSQARTPQGAIFLSPLSPLSPFSPIETSDMRQQRYYGLRQLARVSRAFRDTIVEELPSMAQVTEQVDNVNSYLDLYRIASARRRDPEADVASMNLDTAYTAYTDVTDVNEAYTAYTMHTPVSTRHARRRSSSLSRIQHRSMSSNASASPIARTSFIVPHSASVCSFQDQPARYTLVINVPSPRTPALLIPFTASTAHSARMSMSQSYTVVLSVPRDLKRDTLPETPADEDSPLQKQQKEARARAAILTAMMQSQPTTLALEDAAVPFAPRTPGPRAPYWMRQSYHVSAHGYVRRTHSYSRRSGMRVPPTPKTVRRERRQGWGGEWKAGKLAAAVEGLKEIKTPAPPVPEKDLGPVVVIR